MDKRLGRGWFVCGWVGQPRHRAPSLRSQIIRGHQPLPPRFPFWLKQTFKDHSDHFLSQA